MSEKIIVNHILKYLKSLEGCFAWKEHGGKYGTAGIPDIICCYHGKFYSFEVKMPVGKLTKLQEVTLAKIQNSGGSAVKVTSLEEVKVILNGGVPSDKERAVSAVLPQPRN